MIYDNEPILAVFHSESAGKTEDAENVWQKQIPYLKSVDSSLDKNAPDFEKSISYTFDEMTKRFCNTYKDFSFSNNQIKILSHTPAGYVQKIQIGNKTLTGREVREILARDKDFFKSMFKPKSKHLGSVIPVSGNGDDTNDKNINQ